MVRLFEPNQFSNINSCMDGVLAFYLIVVIIKIDASFPSLSVYQMKSLIHTILFIAYPTLFYSNDFR